MRAQPQAMFNFYLRLDSATEELRRDLEARTGLRGRLLYIACLQALQQRLRHGGAQPVKGIKPLEASK